MKKLTKAILLCLTLQTAVRVEGLNVVEAGGATQIPQL